MPYKRIFQLPRPQKPLSGSIFEMSLFEPFDLFALLDLSDPSE